VKGKAMCNKTERILLWGSGNIAREILQNVSFFQDYILIVGIVDSDPDKWGKKIDGIEIKPFYETLHMFFDKIVIASNIYFDEIRNRLIGELEVNDEIIENPYYFAKVKLLAKYSNSQEKDIQEIVNYLKNHRLDVFNYVFAEKYAVLNVEIYFDETVEMFYVLHFGKKMYMSKRLNTKEKVIAYYRSICMEQDVQSPHLYSSQQFEVHEGDIVVDVGVAEGNFALQYIEKASKIYLIESDEEWIKALQYTFAPYADKIVILNKFISDYSLYSIDTLDNLIEDKVDFLKMDIEGEESNALLGAKKLIARSDKIRCAICAYHRDGDEASINEVAHSMGMIETVSANGYMYYYNDEKQRYISPVLRRGVLRYEKRS